MIKRSHICPAGVTSEATYSEDEAFRYRLSRTWNRLGKSLIFIMLNPSTATEKANDPTIERCQRRAHYTGYGSIVILNLFAFRATDPRDMKKALDPIGRNNDAFIEDALDWHEWDTADIICGWGTHGSFMSRDKQVLHKFRRRGITPQALKVTKDGHPAHPLYLPYSARSVPMETP